MPQMMKLKPMKYKTRTIRFWRDNKSKRVYGFYRDESRKLRSNTAKSKIGVSKLLKKNIDRYGKKR